MTESNHKLYKPNPASPKEAEENYRSIFVNPNQTDGEAIFIKGIVKEGSEFASSLNYFIEPYQTQGQGNMKIIRTCRVSVRMQRSRLVSMTIIPMQVLILVILIISK